MSNACSTAHGRHESTAATIFPCSMAFSSHSGSSKSTICTLDFMHSGRLATQGLLVTATQQPAKHSLSRRFAGRSRSREPIWPIPLTSRPCTSRPCWATAAPRSESIGSKFTARRSMLCTHPPSTDKNRLSGCFADAGIPRPEDLLDSKGQRVQRLDRHHSCPLDPITHDFADSGNINPVLYDRCRLAGQLQNAVLQID